MENVVNLKLDNVEYKMYLPYKDTDDIEQIIVRTNKPYEYDMLQDMISRIPRGSCILDVGMNIANHSLYMIANGCSVIAFEANPKMVNIAKESIKLNNFEKHITIHECGVSDSDGSAFYAKEIPSNYGAMSLTILDSSDANIRGGG